jgi:hypothetical protein
VYIQHIYITCGPDKRARACMCAYNNINGSLILGFLFFFFFLLSITFFRTQMACCYTYAHTPHTIEDEEEEVVIRLAPVGGGFLSLPTPLRVAARVHTHSHVLYVYKILSSSHKTGFHLRRWLMSVCVCVCVCVPQRNKKYTEGRRLSPERV